MEAIGILYLIFTKSQSDFRKNSYFLQKTIKNSKFCINYKNKKVDLYLNTDLLFGRGRRT